MQVYPTLTLREMELNTIFAARRVDKNVNGRDEAS